MATDAVSFIRALGISKTDLLSFSLGGFIAQVIAQKHRDLVRRMILAGTSAAGGEGISNVGSVLQNAVARATAEKKHPRSSRSFSHSLKTAKRRLRNFSSVSALDNRTAICLQHKRPSLLR
jgi:pimeloyl-ACP methyl ester carboxylesterase